MDSPVYFVTFVLPGGEVTGVNLARVLSFDYQVREGWTYMSGNERVYTYSEPPTIMADADASRKAREQWGKDHNLQPFRTSVIWLHESQEGPAICYYGAIADALVRVLRMPSTAVIVNLKQDAGWLPEHYIQEEGKKPEDTETGA